MQLLYRCSSVDEMKTKPLIRSLKSHLPLISPSKRECRGAWVIGSGLRFSHHQGDFRFDLGRSSRGLTFRAEEAIGDEFTRVVEHLATAGSGEAAFEEAAATVHRRYQVEADLSAAELLGFKAGHELARYPAWALVLPWEPQSVEQRYEQYPQAIYRNRSAHGVMFPDPTLTSAVMRVAYSYEAAMSQVMQFERLLKLLSVGGTLSVESLPTITVLRGGPQWRWMMSDEGNHRAYIMNYLGRKFFRCRVRSVVQRNQVSNWPNVQSGLFTANEAISIFDSCFSGSERLKGLL